MPNDCPRGFCSCRFTQETPETLKDLRALTKVEPLGQELETLCLLGTSFETALFSTRNGSALITGQGGLAPLQSNEMPFRISRSRVTARLSVTSPLRIYRSAAAPDLTLPAALIAADASGQIWHRVQYSDAFDQLIANALNPEPEQPVFLLSPEYRPGVIPLANIRNARAHWDHCDMGNHLNDLLHENGKLRRQCLPHVGENRAWEVMPAYVPSFLSYLAHHQRPLVKGVVAPGFLQADLGALANLTEEDGVIISVNDHQTFSIDLKTIESTWVTASTRHWHMEFYNNKGEAVAVLTNSPESDAHAWHDLLMALPRRGY